MSNSARDGRSKEHRDTFGFGDVWTWTAIDADTKLVPSWLVGERTVSDAYLFMTDLKSRWRGPVQLTTDGLRAYSVVAHAACRTARLNAPTSTCWTLELRDLPVRQREPLAAILSLVGKPLVPVTLDPLGIDCSEIVDQADLVRVRLLNI